MANSEQSQAIIADMIQTLLKLAAFGLHDSNRAALREYALACREQLRTESAKTPAPVAPRLVPKATCPYCATSLESLCPWHQEHDDG